LTIFPFQFSIWDASVRLCHETVLVHRVFQFSIWDAWKRRRGGSPAPVSSSFNSLFEMPEPEVFRQIFRVTETAFNSLFEMLKGSEQWPARLLSIQSFNSLFEMRVQEATPRTYCGGAFNSLFEMPFFLVAFLDALSTYAFNSLFEMQLLISWPRRA